MFDVGNALERRGAAVQYTRVTDVYHSPYEKAAIANHSGADVFVSIHRNAMPVPGTASGVETLVYSDRGIPARMARNINSALEAVGWTNLGVQERPGLVVLRETRMPAVLVEAGFLDNEKDNAFLDGNWAATAEAIADGILKTLDMETKEGPYQVQTGVYRVRANAERELHELHSLGFPAFLTEKDGLLFLRSGVYPSLEAAVEAEQRLKRLGFDTLVMRR